MSISRRYKTASIARCQVAPIDIASTKSLDHHALEHWPGQSVAARRRAKGEEIQALEEPVASLVDLQLHGEPATVGVTVRFQGLRRETWGDSLVYYVAMNGTHSDAGMCHEWTSQALASGELVLGASDGDVVALRLRGPMTDAEALCPEGAKETGAGSEPKTCNRGELSFELRWACVPPT